MSINPFKHFAQRREIKAQQKRLQEITSIFARIEQLEKTNLLYYNRRHRRLFIAEPLATVMMAQGANAWSNFLQNVVLYLSHKIIRERWRTLSILRENKAVSEARKQRPAMSKADIHRIRQSARASLKETDVPLSTPEPIDFFVVRNTTDAQPQTTLVGTYDPDTETFDIATWEELQQALQKQE